MARWLNTPVLRTFTNTHSQKDGVGPKNLRPRRPELAWLTAESNQFGTGDLHPLLSYLCRMFSHNTPDEFIPWCQLVGAEPFICLNMGTGTLEDALAWVEYCNRYAHNNLPASSHLNKLILTSSSDTYFANLRRKNGHGEPYGVKVRNYLESDPR